jgi:hypothetical protein
VPGTEPASDTVRKIALLRADERQWRSGPRALSGHGHGADRVGRKRSTRMDYESHLRVHLAPFFGAEPLHRIEPRDIESFIAIKRRQGRVAKSILNYLGLLHSIFEFGQRRGWTATNPLQSHRQAPRGHDRRGHFATSTRSSSKHCCAPRPTPTSAASIA